jgi:IclR family transcriptional regulator, pca regulon regulatory protein
MAAAAGATLQGLERGLAVIQSFSHDAPAMTLSEVARRTDISRATARRILLTLEALGFVRSDGREFSLSPRVLSLGWAYLSSLNLWEVARPFMQDLSAATQETCSACTLDLPDIVFVARVPAPRRILMMSLGVGSRLPAFATAMGRVLLAGLPDAEVAAHLAATPLEPLTHRTVTDPRHLLALVAAVREQGYSLVDEELELGLRSLSVPLHGPDGRPVAALNLCAAAARVSVEEMQVRYLPAMQSTADTISTAWLQKT